MQSRLESFVESLVDIGLGFAIALVTQLIVYPWFGIHEPMAQQFGIATVFTFVSLVRKFIIRRLFANGIYSYFRSRIVRRRYISEPAHHLPCSEVSWP